MPSVFLRRFSAGGRGGAGTLASRLASRAVIRFRGPDTAKFLQGILTNDVRLLFPSPDSGEIPAPPSTAAAYIPTPNLPLFSPPPLYAAMLNFQGRFMYDLFLYRPPRPEASLGPPAGPDDDPSAVLADVDARCLDEILQCFKAYRFRSNVEIDNINEEFKVWQRFGGELPSHAPSDLDPDSASIGWEGSVDPTGASAAQGNNGGWRWFKDPRLASLGFRGIFPSSFIPPLVESDKEIDERHYLLWRIMRGVAEGSTEIPKGEAIPLEYNLEGLNAISFDKGCYLGQELVARTHHRGVVRKRLLSFKFVGDGGEELDDLLLAPGSEIVDGAGKKVGAVTVALGSRGMGILRLEAASREPTADLYVGGKDGARVEVVRPDWWPLEWWM